MSPERLLQHFVQIAEAPAAVPRLRRFILDLAVRGKLVEQNLEDEPASELLKRIEAEKARLVKLGEIRKEKPRQLVDKESVPFNLPPSWEWVPIRKIAADRGQKIPDKEFLYIDVSAIDKESGKIAEPLVLSPDAAPSRARKIVLKGDVIYSCVRPYLLNIAVVDKDFRPEPIVSTAFAVLNGFGMLVPRYLWVVLRSPFFVICVEEKMRGQAYPAINDRDFALLPFPLPPFTEQHRIVAKVDELMALCDELEAAQTKRERRRDRLVAATLHGLNNGDESGEPGIRPTFEESARFYFNQLPLLTTCPEHIHQLRQTILNLAVRGKLVPQDPNDELASELLTKIEAEKSRLVKLGEIRKEKPLPLIDKESVPFNLPPSWQWVPIRKIAADRGQKIPSNDFSYIDVSAIDKERGKIAKPQVLIPEAAPSRARKIVQKGDVIYSCVRPYLLNIAVVDEDFRPEPIVSTAFAVLNGFGMVVPRFLWIVLRSPFFVICVEEKMRGQAYPAINDRDFAPLPFPLPPFAEQHRIVAKVDNLMALCDKLEAQLTNSATTRRHFLEATLQDALSA